MTVKFSLTLLFCSLVFVVKCNDIHFGVATADSRKIFSEIKEADPAIWKRTDDIIVNAPNNELITAVMVTDLRDDKDGEAYIESGGVGQKSVTIGIKSPAVFRGYRFLIEVYSSDPTLSRFQTKGSYYSNDNTQFARKF